MNDDACMTERASLCISALKLDMILGEKMNDGNYCIYEPFAIQCFD